MCLTLLPLGVLVFVENHFWAVRPPLTPGSVRLVHWNVGGRLSPNAQNVLLSQRAQVYVLSEIPDAKSVDEIRAALGSDYRSIVFGNLAVITVGDVRASGWLINRRRMRAQVVTWRRVGEDIPLLVVDLPSEIDIPRDPLLREINKLIERHQPDLVVGDFNAPRRSRALCELPNGYSHSYDTAGAGWSYTWPVPVPMYAARPMPAFIKDNSRAIRTRLVDFKRPPDASLRLCPDGRRMRGPPGHSLAVSDSTNITLKINPCHWWAVPSRLDSALRSEV